MKRKLANRRYSKLSKWREEANLVVAALSNGKIFMNFGDSSAILTKSDSIRAVSETIPESAIRNLMLKCLLDAERDSAGGAFVALSAIAGCADSEVELGKRFRLRDVQRSLSNITDPFVAAIVMDAVKLSGRRGKIMLDTSNVMRTEITHGTQACKWSPDASFFSNVGQAKLSFQNCRVAFIDGIIESVAECHKLFHTSYESRTPIIIFARGYADEVITTAAVNIQRQTAQIVPIVIPFDEVGVNGMADIASCFGAEVLTSDKGQLISTIDVDSLKLAERITCTASSTEIEMRDNRVEDVVRKLVGRLGKDDSQSDLIRRRISALGSGLVTVKIGADKKSEAGIMRDRVDFGLRYVRLCMMHGVGKYGDLLFPRVSIARGQEAAQSFLSILENCGEVLEVDRCG